MKTTILLMFSLILLTGSLSGQKTRFNFIDSEIDKKSVPIPDPFDLQLRKPEFNPSKKSDDLITNDPERFFLLQDSLLRRRFAIRQHSSSAAEEEFPGALRFYGYPPEKNQKINGNLMIIRPDTDSKYFLIIKYPINNTITK
jgi:hypothetical protein